MLCPFALGNLILQRALRMTFFFFFAKVTHMRHFCVFRTSPACSGQVHIFQPSSAHSCELGGDGDAGSLTPRRSVAPIRCMRWRMWRNTCVIHSGVDPPPLHHPHHLRSHFWLKSGSSAGVPSWVRHICLTRCCTGARACTAWFRFLSSCALLFCRRNWMVRNSVGGWWCRHHHMTQAIWWKAVLPQFWYLNVVLMAAMLGWGVYGSGRPELVSRFVVMREEGVARGP